MSALDQYLALIRSHSRFLAFGFLMAFTSSAGQTYFIGIFGPEIRVSFNLNHTQWGSIYLIGTLCSALVLPWSGQLIDRIRLPVFTTIVIAGLASACIAISLANSILLLVFSIFLLRQFGQGLTSHTSVTSMARYLTGNRGKGIAIASMGYSTGEALLPVLAVSAIVVLGWRPAFLIAAICVFLILPLALWTLRGHSIRHHNFTRDQESGFNSTEIVISKSSRQMLGELRFYMLLPAVLTPSYIGTALFFHHLTLAEEKGWSAIWVTGNYWLYALCTIVTSLISGPLIDRFSAARILPCFLVPLMMALGILVPAINPVWVLPYMVLLGINSGIHFTAVSSLWAEIYGTRYLGGIKSTVGAFSVFASALGPVSVGLILDMGFNFDAVSIYFISFSALSTLLLVYGLRKFHPTPV